MPTNPVPGGYLDRQHLARARRHNRNARQVVHIIITERPGIDRLYQLLALIACELGSQDDELERMDNIRSDWRGDQP